jgi:PleD family two-component response regulator
MANTSKKPKIVLVEDDQFIIDMYKIKLASDFDLKVALDGKDGLDLIRQFKPDLVLLDIILPRLDGFEVLEEMKKDPDLKDIPVLLLTNLGQRDNIRRGLRLGALDYIIKAHYTPGEVAEKIKQVLEQIEMQKKA